MPEQKQTKFTVPMHGISYKTTLATAVATAIGGLVPAFAQSDIAAIEQITVTASKRGDTNVQNFAGSIQAFSTEDIRRQNLFSMEDYARHTPGMAYFGNQPGAGKIFFRGIADAPDTFIAQASAAVYLDEQPITQTAQVDVRLIDIERVEALSGPQGTLYGSSSQSGTLRIVTNKPDPTRFESFADITLKSMQEGDASYDLSAMLNIPVIEDKVAIRLVGFSASEGGFIDNVLGKTANSEATGKQALGGAQLNTAAVKNDWNKTTIDGARVSAKWFINDNWSLTSAIAHQSVTAAAENTYDPTVGDLQLIAFSPDSRTDDWSQYAFSLEASLGNFQLTSATTYFTRDSVDTQDTTSYTAYFGSFCSGEAAGYNVYCFQPAGQYYTYNDPVGFLVNDQANTSLSQELRVAFSNERLDWVAGVFWEDREEEWDFTAEAENYATSQAMDYWQNLYAVAPPVSDVWWFSADKTNWATFAVFGEGTFHVSDAFSVTVGGRWFEVDSSKLYYVENPGGRRTPSGQLLNGNAAGKWGCLFDQAPCNVNDSNNPNDDGFNRIDSSDHDIAIKLSMQWKLSEDKMLYALYSEGFRPGGVNRNRGAPALLPSYSADFLVNHEIGFKSQWAEGQLQVNAVLFLQDWNDYQIEIVDPSRDPCDSVDPIQPCGQPWQKGVTNVGNASSDGFELQLRAAAANGLVISANAAWLNAEIKAEVPGLEGIGSGATLPFAPKFKSSVVTQYNWRSSLLGSNESYLQYSFSHVGSSLNQVQQIVGGPAPQMKMQRYQVSNVKIGLIGSQWEASVFINNLGDARGQLYHDVTDFEPFYGRQRTSVIRPREIGLRFFKSWE